MHAEWQKFLNERGATIHENTVEHFGQAGLEAGRVLDGDIIADCSDLGILRLSGDDARNFLHNQLSNDVSGLQENETRLAAYCNPKGRTLAIARLYSKADAIYMLLPRDIIEAVARRLKMFVLMSKVAIEDVSDELVVSGISGANVAGKLASHLGELPLKQEGISHHQETSIIRLPQHDSRYLLVAPAPDMISAWQQLENTASPVGHAAWQLLDIHTGQPQVYASTVEAFVPQMLNMHAINGISFKKGCYPGQEIVARMYYLGKLKRRMYLAHIEGCDCPAPGENLYAGHTDSAQGAGQVVMAAPAAGGGCDLLAVCPVSTVEDGPVQLGSADGPQLQFRPLPYEVPLERKAG